MEIVLAILGWPIIGPILRRGVSMFGMKDSPNIVLAESLSLVALPDETRPGYDRWWHLGVCNEQRNGASSWLTTRTAEHCTVEIQFVSERTDAIIARPGVFLTGEASFPAEVFSLVADHPTYIPVYLNNDGPWSTVHPMYPNLRLPAGVYITGARFMRDDLAVRELVPTGAYKVVVRVRHGKDYVAREFSVDVA